jgi:mannosyl-3-phosphoglycerate phosphatase family protein
MPNILVVTDLDGSLLHPSTYAFDEALPALRQLWERDVPLVLCSSKTRAEIEVYRERLHNQHPFIVENGAEIFIPDGYFSFSVEGKKRDEYRVISRGTPYPEIRRQFVQIRDTLGVLARGFGDMTLDEVASRTGLTSEEAARAMQRKYDEPFVFSDEPDELFLHTIETAGLRWTQGRLFHIMGNHDKGKAMTILRGFFEKKLGLVSLIGLGDSLNDLPLLAVVEQPVLIRKEDGSHDSRISIPGLYLTEGIGPAGWNEAVLKFLSNE